MRQRLRPFVRSCVALLLALSGSPVNAFARSPEPLPSSVSSSALSNGSGAASQGAVASGLAGASTSSDQTHSPEPTPSAEPTAPPSTGAPLPQVRVEDDELAVDYAGTWGSVWSRASSGQSHMTSDRAGSAATISFDGTSVAFVSRRGPDCGWAKVYIDGVLQGRVDLYARTVERPSTAWRSKPLEPGAHTARVVAEGAKSAASSASKVRVDAFDVAGTPMARGIAGTGVNSGNSRLAKGGRWWASSQPAAYGETTWRSETRGATVSVRFKGTGVTWIGCKDSALGKAEVLIDGRRIGTVSQYASTRRTRRTAFARQGLSDGVHTLTVRVLGSASSGAGKRVDVDAFIVRGSLLQAYRPAPFRYPWSNYIVIDKSSFRLYLVKGGLLVKTYRVAHGKWSTPTPSRVWRVGAKYHTSSGGVYGPRKMRLFKRVRTSRGYVYQYTRYGIHGTNEPWVIGTRASHGCIRLNNRDALDLYPRVPLYTIVVTRD